MSACSTILGGLWQSGLYMATDCNLVHLHFMQSLGNYITSNVKATIAFSGTTPVGTPVTGTDVMTMNGSLTGSTMTSFAIPAKDGNGMYMDGSAEWIAWMNQVYAGIDKSLYSVGVAGTAPIGPIPPFILTSPTFTRNDILAVHQASWDDPQGSVLDTFAMFIMKDMATFFTLSFPATFMGATGVATVTSITTP